MISSNAKRSAVWGAVLLFSPDFLNSGLNRKKAPNEILCSSEEHVDLSRSGSNCHMHKLLPHIQGSYP